MNGAALEAPKRGSRALRSRSDIAEAERAKRNHRSHGATLEACEMQRIIPVSDEEIPEYREVRAKPAPPRRVPIRLCGCGRYWNPKRLSERKCRLCDDRFERVKRTKKAWRARRERAG